MYFVILAKPSQENKDFTLELYTIDYQNGN